VAAVAASFSAAHRGGEGPPLLLVHGFTDTWRTWELVLGKLERSYEVLAPTLAGHAGAAPVAGRLNPDALLDVLERQMDAAGWETAHMGGNSLGGYLALGLAARGRAETVVALAPAAGWAEEGDFYAGTVVPFFTAVREQLTAAEPQLDALLASPEGRRLATSQTLCNFEHIPVELLAHQARGMIACDGAPELMQSGLDEGFSLDAERIECPVRIVWGVEDRVLPWPTAAVRYRDEWLPNADWIVLDGVGHMPQLDVPLETAELIAGVAVR
jgi:pimeloyl-ACP methyl ester carboxylesterase